jgi:hypothetical protein
MKIWSKVQAMLLFAIAALMIAPPLMAQQEYTLGTGTTTNTSTAYPAPFGLYYNSSRTQYLVLASELQALGATPGKIKSLALYIENGNGSSGHNGFKISIKQTTATTMSAVSGTNPLDYGGGYTRVYGPVDYPQAWQGADVPANWTTGWNKFTFTTPFEWDGSSNLVIEFGHSNYPNGYSWNGHPSVRYTATSFESTRAIYSDGCDVTQNPPTCTPNQASSTTQRQQRANMRFEIEGGISASFPSSTPPNNILLVGENYNGATSDRPKPSVTFNQANGTAYQITYRIVNSAGQTVYQALDPTSGGTTINYTGTANGGYVYTFNRATGSNGIADGTFSTFGLTGGNYTVQATIKAGTAAAVNYTSSFTLALQYDLEATSIIFPVKDKVYPLGIQLPVAAKFTNFGLNNVTAFKAIAVITSNGIEVYRDTVNYVGSFSTGQSVTIDFPKRFIPTSVATYDIYVYAPVDHVQPNDVVPTNNMFPRTGSGYTFQGKYEVELKADKIIRPEQDGEYYINRTFRPIVQVANLGVSTQSEVPVRLVIRQGNSQGPIVYDQEQLIDDIPLTQAAIMAMNVPFTPTVSGLHTAILSVSTTGDGVPSNNTTMVTFNVVSGMTGTYTIGTTMFGDRNFTTIQAAVDALYKRGVIGPVVFELTDANYTVGTGATNQAALEITSTVIGVNATNTVIFKPSQARSTTRASININLVSGNGVGILMAEGYKPRNQFALFNEPGFSTQENANATGYITWDGGVQKSMRFTLQATTPHRAVFYLGSESNNTTLRNLLIENSPQVTASYASSLPQSRFDQGNLTFSYDPDVRTLTNGTINTYSAGVVVRNTPTAVSNLQVFANGRADTNTSDNNRIIGTEISGFGYGVVGIGIGALYQPWLGRFGNYYMRNLEIRDNVIQNISKAGIYLANTESADVSGNRIAAVGVSTTGIAGDAFGIRTGGETSYNNLDMHIARNEISGVTSNTFTRGIAVEQVEQEMQAGSGVVYRFPDQNGDNKVTSNMIWGINRTSAAANAVGIHFFTQRSQSLTGINQILTAQRSGFFTEGDTIAGNTIFMENDGQQITGIVAGIGIQQARTAFVYNNAIAMLGSAPVAPQATTVHSALVFQSMANQPIRTGPLAGTMTDNAIMSNHNAFWTPNATIARFIQVDDQSRVLNNGSYDEYTTLTQWRQGAGQDINSVYGNFTNDYAKFGTAPLQRLRVITSPFTPIGSILNNRGERLQNLGNDIDNQTRGAAGQRPDIGADEFNGRLYVNDIESVEILSPGAYRSQSGNFRDAEYIMTEAPVDIMTRVRNSGSTGQATAPVTIKIYQELPGSAQLSPVPAIGAYGAPDPTLIRTIQANLPAGESVDLDYSSLNFMPKTYAELGLTPPAQFSSMARNVTPRYKIEIETIADENSANNITSKEVRFYIVKSPIRMLVSAIGTTFDMTAGPTQNMIAGRLNYDTLKTALSALGWTNNNSTIGVYDIFDRGNWEPRSVDYTPYRTLLWAHDSQAMSMTERNDLRDYVYSGSISDKKNLAISSQEIARKHIGLNPLNDEMFVREVLRAQYVTAPGTPFIPNYDGKRVIGVAIAEGTADFVRVTQFAADLAPVPALLRIYSDANTEGLARTAYKYESRSTGVVDSVMGVASAATYANVVYLGVDWRHFARTNNQSRSGAERVLRGILDYFEKNGGTVVPVELAEGLKGEALRRDNAWTVNLWWKVASELNVANYEVERAEASAKGVSEFTSVGSKAPGMVDYRMEDRSVEAGRSYIYRLRSTDRDGSFSLSNEVEISISDDAAQTMTMSPMPVVSSSELEYTAEGDVQFIVFDAAGREVMRLAGANGTANFNAAGLSSGAYTIQMMVNGIANGTMTISVVK